MTYFSFVSLILLKTLENNCKELYKQTKSNLEKIKFGSWKAELPDKRKQKSHKSARKAEKQSGLHCWTSTGPGINRIVRVNVKMMWRWKRNGCRFSALFFVWLIDLDYKFQGKNSGLFIANFSTWTWLLHLVRNICYINNEWVMWMIKKHDTNYNDFHF